ncbi:hypothetical protein GJAV_G00255130 [Gymnothorax javanicus]|nr:hypothetical protein GJAV_G00255130 [Gymnothorax javanicus]
MSYLWILLLASLAIGTKGQDGFDLSDALGGDDDDTPTKRPLPNIPKDPKKPGDDALDLLDAFGSEDTPAKPKPKPKPKPSGGGDDGLDLYDALKPDPSEPKKPAFDRPKGGGTGGGSFGDDDLVDLVGGGGGEYKPDPGKGGGGKYPGKYPSEPYDYDGGKGYGDGQKVAPKSTMTSILSVVGVVLVGAVSSYFGYKKRQMCMGGRGGNPMGGGMNFGGGGGRYGPPGPRQGGMGRGGGGGGAGGLISNILRMV